MVIVVGNLVGLLHWGTMDVGVFGFGSCFSSLGLLRFFKDFPVSCLKLYTRLLANRGKKAGLNSHLWEL